MQSVKVVVAGPSGSGKTSFIKATSEIAVLSTERTIGGGPGGGGGETTVAMDFGRITISDEVVLYLFGTPGQGRFSPMWETLAEGMLGFVVLVDGEDTESLSDAAEMIAFFGEMSDVPYVVAANRLGDGDTGSIEHVRSSLALDQSVPLFACDAREKESVKTVLLGLMEWVLASAG